MDSNRNLSSVSASRARIAAPQVLEQASPWVPPLAFREQPATIRVFPVRRPGWFSLCAKRVIDIVGALAGLVLCAIAYVICARRTRRETGGSVIFRQQRVGERGRVFTVYKLRTMMADAEARLHELMPYNEMKGHIFKIREDPRVTRLGRFLRRYHIDELPQFWNVLRGEMSLVGARPPTVDEAAKYERHHWRRLDMKPGLTGLWQVSGNGSVYDFEQVVEMDRWYVDNWSLLLDLKILVKTVWALPGGRGW